MKFRTKNMEIYIMITTRNDSVVHLQQMLELDIFEVGHAVLDPKWSYKNVCYSFSQIYIPVNGCGELVLQDQTVKLIPGNIYIVSAETKYSCHCDNMLEKYMIDFSLTFPDKVDILSHAGCIILADENCVRESIVHVAAHTDSFAALQLKQCVYSILCRAFAVHPALLPKKPKYSSQTHAVLDYINANLSAQITISQIADALFLSKLTLQRHFKDDMGMPLGKYMDDRLITLAKRYLLDPSLSIKQISDTLGFADQFYFSRKFSAKVGMPPNKFRNMHKK